MKFHKAMDCMTQLEGGAKTLTRYEWDKDGGGTKGGITQNTFSSYLKMYGMPNRDISTMTPIERTGITLHFYWMPAGAMLPLGLDFMAFQFGFVTYPTTAIKKLQEVLADRKLYRGKIDGLLGPISLSAMDCLTKADVKEILKQYAIRQKEHFTKIDEADGVIGDDPVAGWHNRVDKALRMSLADANGICNG